jgi:hypothetical protein
MSFPKHIQMIKNQHFILLNLVGGWGGDLCVGGLACW